MSSFTGNAFSGNAFSGFPPKTDYIPVPAPLFGSLLEEIQDLGELQCALRLLFLLHRRRGSPRFVTAGALKADVVLLRALGHGAPEESPQTALELALEGCVARGLFLRLGVRFGGRQEELLFLNTPADQRAMERIRRGELALPSLPDLEPLEEAPLLRDIYTLYEENIGIITPLIADELRDAEEAYLPSWIQEAIQEAVANNKRNWRYITAILRRWAREGKASGAPGRHPETVPATRLPRHPQGPLLRR